MRALLWAFAFIVSTTCAGVAIGRYTVHGAALAVAPGPTMPRMIADPQASDDAGVADDAPSARWRQLAPDFRPLAPADQPE